jgi:PmbA protein
MTSLLDQSALTTLAERLVEAARAAGADAADAVALRSVSLGVDARDGRVEESERSESDDVGLRVLVGRRQAVVSTNDIRGDGVATLAERAVAMARVAPEDPYAGSATSSRARFPISICSIPTCPRWHIWKSLRLPPRRRRSQCQG